MGRINKTRINIKALDNLVKDLGRKVSIKVGIIGDKATQIHEGTKLTNAELGAAHEFGATINHPGGTPYIIKEDGTAQFVSKEKGGKLPKTKPHEIILPTRSFLRAPLLSPEGKAAIKKEVLSKDYIKENIGKDRELNKIAWSNNAEGIIDAIGFAIGAAAHNRVIKAFETEGFGNWKPTTSQSKKKRKYNTNNPTLVDTGQLKESITYEVKIK